MQKRLVCEAHPDQPWGHEGRAELRESFVQMLSATKMQIVFLNLFANCGLNEYLRIVPQLDRAPATQIWVRPNRTERGFNGSFQKTTADQVSPYPPETVLFTALPMLCMSSPMPRIVAHPSEAETTKSNDQRSNFFFFIFTSVRYGAASMPRP